MNAQEKALLLSVARILRNHLGDHANANFSDIHYDLRLLVQALQPYESNIVNLKPDQEKK